MAYTQAHLDALEAALAKGEKRVTFGDKTVEYRTVDELKAAIDVVKRDIFEQAVATGLCPVRHVRSESQPGRASDELGHENSHPVRRGPHP